MELYLEYLCGFWNYFEIGDVFNNVVSLKSNVGLSFFDGFFVLLVTLHDSLLLTFNFWIDE